MREKRLTLLLWNSLENQTTQTNLWMRINGFGCQSKRRLCEVSQEAETPTHHAQMHSLRHENARRRRQSYPLFLAFTFSLSIFRPTHCLTFSSCAQNPHQSAAFVKAEVGGSPWDRRLLEDPVQNLLTAETAHINATRQKQNLENSAVAGFTLTHTQRSIAPQTLKAGAFYLPLKSVGTSCCF